jgi:hypothetical protein
MKSVAESFEKFPITNHLCRGIEVREGWRRCASRGGTGGDGVDDLDDLAGGFEPSAISALNLDLRLRAAWFRRTPAPALLGWSRTPRCCFLRHGLWPCLTAIGPQRGRAERRSATSSLEWPRQLRRQGREGGAAHRHRGCQQPAGAADRAGQRIWRSRSTSDRPRGRRWPWRWLPWR